jgi:hyperosmotically inducible periplasmic protein
MMMRLSLNFLLACVLLLTGATLLGAQQDSNAGQAVPADNTKINQRDKNQAEPTADQQKENPSDRQLAAQIRRAIVKDKSLSTDAHNVKIIVQNGSVTLRGPVKSDDEKQAIEAKAAQVVGGTDKINDQIQVAPK